MPAGRQYSSVARSPPPALGMSCAGGPGGYAPAPGTMGAVSPPSPGGLAAPKPPVAAAQLSAYDELAQATPILAGVGRAVIVELVKVVETEPRVVWVSVMPLT